MTLRILEILTLEGTQIGHLKLNETNGMRLQKARVRYPYNKWLANMGLLTEGKDYSHLRFEEYISNLEECLKKFSKNKILVKEKKLNPKIEKLLLEFYEQNKSYSTNVESGSIDKYRIII